MKKYYALEENKEESSADVYIFGDIVSWEWLENDTSSYTLAKELQELDAKNINVHINSYGGEVAEGLAIYNTLKNSKAKVTTICEGFACSSASVVFMAGEERIMRSASLLMIHNPWTCAAGNAEELRKQADDLETIGSAAIAAYTDAELSLTEKKLQKMLDAETWITPADALEWGFATSISKGGATENATEKAAASGRQAMFDAIAASLHATPAPPGDPDPPGPPQDSKPTDPPKDEKPEETPRDKGSAAKKTAAFFNAFLGATERKVK